MKESLITLEIINQFEMNLIEEEKSKATIEKYIRDVTAFSNFCKSDASLTKETVIAYKKHLLTSGSAISSINSMLASLNSLFRFMNRNDLIIKSLKVQQQMFCSESKELLISVDFLM